MNENSEKTVVITETDDGRYQIQNNGISEFALIGILECIVFNLKTAGQDALQMTKQKLPDQPKEIIQEQKVTVARSNPVQEPNREQNSNREVVDKPKATDLRTRISNAVKAIRSLGGEAAESELSGATDEELRAHLEQLTAQYKRLKSSKGK
jgi:hypothetical protein